MTETSTGSDTPIGRCLDRWMDVLHGDVESLPAVLHPDAVLHSPVLFAPQAGRDTVAMYLTAAAAAFVGVGPLVGAVAPPADGGKPVRHPTGDDWDGRFRYVRKVVGDRDAVLEFETTMDGNYVNGVDMISCDDDGLITDFKVMVRPARAVDAVKAQMLAALELFQAGGEGST
jgi:hypothetical protein